MGDYRISRRQLLGGAAVAAGAAALGGVPGLGGLGGLRTVSALTGRSSLVLPPGSRPDPTKPEGIDLLPQIEHIIIYVQENHSYDNYFGMLGKGDGFTLDGQGRPTNTNPDLHGDPVALFHMPSTCDLTTSASQDWNGTHLSWNGGQNDGFVTSANGATGSMGYWDGTDLPFYYGLAEDFPLCDRWFCSVMGQTLANRRYVQAATSAGMVSSDPNEVLKFPNAPNGTIWDRLDDHGISWLDYAVDLPDILLFQDLYKARGDRVKTYDQFLLDCETGKLPQVSIISPGWKVWTEENPYDIQLGEYLSAAIINAVMHGPAWEKTALLMTWDEHGGYYDHVPPPKAIAPDNIPPNITSPPDQPGGFDQLGFRVPGFIISPYARPNYLSHVVHDHTSMLKFIETKFNLGALTFRDANADNLFDAFDFSRPAFAEPPVLPAPGLPASGSTCEPRQAPPKTSVPVPAGPTTTTTTTTTAPAGTTTVPGPTTIGDQVLARTGRNVAPLAAVGGASVLAGVAALMAERQLHERRATPDADESTP